MSELSRVNLFLEEAGEELGLNSSSIMSLTLVMEEAISNVIFYAYHKENETLAIEISLLFEKRVLTIMLADTGPAFDPTTKKDPDITLSAEDRPIGGLGIFLIKKIMDEVSYQREGERNVFIMRKNIK